MTTRKKKTIPLSAKVLLMISFSVASLAFFRFYSLLRPAACGALYKELISGMIVLLICFLNYYILYPCFFERRRYLLYVLFSIITVVISALVELMLVFPQISVIINNVIDLSIEDYIPILTLALSFRNLCFYSFFFIIKLLETIYEENIAIEHSLIKNNHLIVAKDLDNNTFTIPISEIMYCQQKENYAYIYLSDGRSLVRRCSMRSLSEDLGDYCALRISRSVLVMFSHIQSYNSKEIYIQTYDGLKGFEITESYRNNALKQMKLHRVPASAETNGFFEKHQDEETETNNDDYLLNENNQASQIILQFIKENTNCKGDDITRYSKLSLRTVNRILAQLKKDGLIEYTGSKKTGGYQVVKERQEA